ncbi:MAG: helix-turn-helix transcriptional regulator [Desulfatibacillum sp.]|nr:helix-turn-helix transcriptional regulator [Desulfatibacillum sp.]
MDNICSDRDCPVYGALQLIGNKWVLIILAQLMGGAKRFGELKKAIPEISPKMLTQQLRKLEKEGIVERKVYPEIPPRVEYSLTPKGWALEPVFKQIIIWGVKHS